MTSATTPSPGVVTASSVLEVAYLPYYAFDGNNAQRWVPDESLGQWIQFDMGAGNEIIEPNFLYYGCAFYYITEGSFEGSNTGAFAGEETVFTSWSKGS